MLDYQRKQGRLPPRLTFALAALIAFYRGREIRDGALIGRRDGADYRIQDDAAVLDAFRDAWQAAGDRPSTDACLALVRGVLGARRLLGPGPDRGAARLRRRRRAAPRRHLQPAASAPRSNASPERRGSVRPRLRRLALIWEGEDPDPSPLAPRSGERARVRGPRRRYGTSKSVQP